jgi:hypothetical protein
MGSFISIASSSHTDVAGSLDGGIVGKLSMTFDNACAAWVLLSGRVHSSQYDVSWNDTSDGGSRDNFTVYTGFTRF